METEPRNPRSRWNPWMAVPAVTLVLVPFAFFAAVPIPIVLMEMGWNPP